MKESDQDVADLLRGDAALLDAAKKGNLARVQKLLNPENINCRDSQVRLKGERGADDAIPWLGQSGAKMRAGWKALTFAVICR